MTLVTCHGCWFGGGKTLAGMTLGTCQGCFGLGEVELWQGPRFMTLCLCSSQELRSACYVNECSKLKLLFNTFMQ